MLVHNRIVRSIINCRLVHLCCEPIFTKNYLLILDELDFTNSDLVTREHLIFKKGDFTWLSGNPTTELDEDGVNEDIIME